MLKRFNTKKEALNWMYKLLEEEDCIDNERFAYVDDKKQMSKYHKQQEEGCCGFFDEAIVVDGKKAMIGCNFGH